MKTTIGNLKNLFKDLAEGHVDRSRMQARGYDEADIDADYTDRANESVEMEGVEEEGVSQAKRLAHGYAGEEPADYDTGGEGLDMEEMGLNESVPMALRAKLHVVTPDDAPQMGPPMKMVNFVPEPEDAGVRFDQEDESAPPGFEKVVKGLKRNPEVDNPFAVAWSMKDKGDKPKEASMPSLKKVLKKKK